MDGKLGVDDIGNLVCIAGTGQPSSPSPFSTLFRQAGSRTGKAAHAWPTMERKDTVRICSRHIGYGRRFDRRKIFGIERRLFRLLLITIGMCLLLGPKVVGQSQPCSTTGGIRDTYVRAWFPGNSYDDDSRMWIRVGADFAFFSFAGPSSRFEFTLSSRTSNNPITIVAHRLKEPWPAGMTYSIWSAIRDDMLDGMLDQVLVSKLGRYSLNTYGAQHIMLEAQGISVGYAIASSDGQIDKPTWCRELAAPTPTPRATSAPISPINRITVPSDLLPIIMQHALIANEYEPGTCFEIAADKDGNGRSTAPDFLIVIHMPDETIHRWKFQWFENDALYMSPASHPCDVAVEYLR